jgi:hypothetical protein
MRISAPGTLLEIIVYEVTRKASIDCSACSERARQMNEWGWSGCWQNRETITQWLVEEAQRRGHAISKNTVYGLLAAAIRERFRA